MMTNNKLSVPYQVYSDLGYIDPWSVKTMEQEENYYKSLLYGCMKCDRIESSIQLILIHDCSNNGKSKYEQHQQEALNRKITKITGLDKTMNIHNNKTTKGEEI
jgi:hypothetical protein